MKKLLMALWIFCSVDANAQVYSGSLQGKLFFCSENAAVNGLCSTKENQNSIAAGQKLIVNFYPKGSSGFSINGPMQNMSVILGFKGTNSTMTLPLVAASDSSSYPNIAVAVVPRLPASSGSVSLQLVVEGPLPAGTDEFYISYRLYTDSKLGRILPVKTLQPRIVTTSR